MPKRTDNEHRTALTASPISENSMTTIAVIGCGGIGCRHIQALGRLPMTAEVHAIDLSDTARARAVDLFRESAANTGSPARILDAGSPGELPQRIDVVIIATRAVHRLAALRDVLKDREIGHLILEKFLFAQRHEFAQARTLLSGHRAWVNCPRRLYPGYRSLAEKLQSARFVHLHVTGSARVAPLGTIGIHFADLLDSFARPAGIELDITLDDPGLVDANRGLQDFSGRLALGMNEGRALLRHDALSDSDAPHLITLTSDLLRCVIDEREQRAELAEAAHGWKTQPIKFEVPVQSMLTHQVVQSLLADGRCGLTPYARSARLHIGLFDTLMSAYRSLAADPFLETLPFT
jgi:hypothetical protein